MEEVPYTENSWKLVYARLFTDEEIAAIDSAIVIESPYGLSACFSLNSGQYAGKKQEIPLSIQSTLQVGDRIDFKVAKLLTLCRNGANIVRVIE